MTGYLGVRICNRKYSFSSGQTPKTVCNKRASEDTVAGLLIQADTVIEPTFFEVWQNRFLYFGLIVGNLDGLIWLISMKESVEYQIKKINLGFWSLNIQYLFTTVLCIFLYYKFTISVMLALIKNKHFS